VSHSDAWRGLFSQQAHDVLHLAHRGLADPNTCLGSDSCTQLLQRRIGLIAHRALDDRTGGRVQAGFLSARVGLQGNVPGGAVLAQHLLDRRETYAEHVGNGRWEPNRRSQERRIF
jgi:hypothetical protein